MESELVFKMAAERYAICRECPLFDKAMRKCTDCGCFMLIKTKVPAAECPQHKWGKMDLGDEAATE